MTDKSKWRFRYKSLKVQEAMAEFEGWTENELIKHILDLRKELIQLEKDNEALIAKQNPISDPEKEEKAAEGLSEKNFNVQWSYPTKVAFLLTIKNKPLTSEEINKLLLKIDKPYSAYADPKATLSVYLTMAVKRGRIKKIKLPGIKELYFALPEWVENDKLMPKYKAKIKQF